MAKFLIGFTTLELELLTHATKRGQEIVQISFSCEFAFTFLQLQNSKTKSVTTENNDCQKLKERINLLRFSQSLRNKNKFEKFPIPVTSRISLHDGNAEEEVGQILMFQLQTEHKFESSFYFSFDFFCIFPSMLFGLEKHNTARRKGERWVESRSNN